MWLIASIVAIIMITGSLAGCGDQKQLPKPNADIEGYLTSSPVKKGSPIIARVIIKNIDKEKTINSVMLQFALPEDLFTLPDDLFSEGVIITNVNLGGEQDYNIFRWKDLNIKPGTEKELKISMQANTPGNYKAEIFVYDEDSDPHKLFVGSDGKKACLTFKNLRIID